MKIMRDIEITTCARYSSILNKYLLINVVKGIWSYMNISITGDGIKLAGQNRQNANPMSSAPTRAIATQGAYSIYSIRNKELMASLTLWACLYLMINKTIVFNITIAINRT